MIRVHRKCTSSGSFPITSMELDAPFPTRSPYFWNMREELLLPPLARSPSDPTELIDGPVAFLQGGEGHPSLLAMGSIEELRVELPGRAFQDLQSFSEKSDDWLFGILSYELKDEVEALSSEGSDPIGFPALHFFRPRVLFKLEQEKTLAEFFPEAISETEVKELHKTLSEEEGGPSSSSIRLHPRTDRNNYIKAVGTLLSHIQQGDIYEANFCQEFFAEKAPIAPFRTFRELQRLADAPMAAYYRLGGAHLICASPERFLRIDGQEVLAQPIKGTAPRGANEKEDHELAEKLRTDPKERAENTMIVDLVRNDLAWSAAKGSVEVEELCAVHPFQTVHQMISSIRSRIDPNRSPVDVIRHAFPMGSMTGAPKVRAMDLIEQYEGMRRGLYSGSVVYRTPEGNWDLNVVIRSLFYNDADEYLSAKVGGAITARSDPQKEYEECLLKVEALKKAIS